MKNKVLFYVNDGNNDPELLEDMWVVFATESEIELDNIVGEALFTLGVESKVERIGTFCGDDGSMCEDYLLHPTSGVTGDQIRILAKQLGFVEDQRLEECGWG